MYKAFTLIVLVLVGTAYGSNTFEPQLNVLHRFGSKINPVGLDLCPACINEAVELINVVINVILDEGILGSCADLCQAVYNKSGSKDLGELCDIGCDAVGLDEYIKLLVNADIDPIYYCQEVHMCPSKIILIEIYMNKYSFSVKDDGDAKFTNFGVTPKIGPEGTTFIIDLSFKTVNGTGTGTFTFDVTDPKNQTTGDLYWFEEKKAGTYIEKLQFETLAIPHCNPSDSKNSSLFISINLLFDFFSLSIELCAWPLGTYKVVGQICNGDCGSHHPHTGVYDTAASSFELTKKP